MAIPSLSFENPGNVISKWIWTEECVLGQEDEQHFLGWFLCTLGSLERITNVPFGKLYTDFSSSLHISQLRTLRSPTVRKTLYLSVFQIDLTTEKWVFLFLFLASNTYQYTTECQFSRAIVFLCVPIEVII